MSKNIEKTKTDSEILYDVLMASGVHGLSFYNCQDLNDIVDKWVQLDCFNLTVNTPTLPEDDLIDPYATIFGSKHGRAQIEGFYVRIASREYLVLYCFKTLENAVDFMKRIRETYSATLNQ